MDLLYRGVNAAMYDALKGKLSPHHKGIGKPYSRQHQFDDVQFGVDPQFGGGSINESLIHQNYKDCGEDRYITSGISTTPHIEKAHRYGSNEGEHSHYYIYVIDRKILSLYNVTEQPGLQFPKKPDDDEVTLTAQDYGTLPDEIILEVLEFPQNQISKEDF
jgi:hypothetical protein